MVDSLRPPILKRRLGDHAANHAKIYIEIEIEIEINIDLHGMPCIIGLHVDVSHVQIDALVRFTTTTVGVCHIPVESIR